MRTRNDDLLEAVQNDDIEKAKDALNNGADACITINDRPVLSQVESAGMMKLLLDCGADPDASVKAYPNLFQDHSYPQSLLSFFYNNDSYEIATALVNYRPCKISNDTINSVLVGLIGRTDLYFRGKDAFILALIRASTDLQKGDLTSSPFLHACNKGSKDLINLMLNNNIFLWDDIRLNQFKSPPSYCVRKLEFTSEIIETIKQLFKENILQHCVSIWQLYRLAKYTNENTKEGPLAKLPKEVMEYIVLFVFKTLPLEALEYYTNYACQNSETKRMEDFGILYSLLEKYISGNNHTFWNENKSLCPYKFFAKANQKAANEGLEAKTLSLLNGNIDKM